MKVQREKRLSAEYKKAIYEILSTKVKDINLTQMFSVLRCDVTNDLKHAKVFMSIFSTDDQKKQATFAAIERSAKFVRHELSKIMNTRTVPEIHFILDDSLEYSEKINKIIKSINDES